MKAIFPFLYASLAWTSTLPARAVVQPDLNIAAQNALTVSCEPFDRPALDWRSCYNAWEKMQDSLSGGTEQKLHFLGRHVRPYGPPGTMWVILWTAYAVSLCRGR